jgi:HK97 gp10 family phage protein
MSTEVLGVEATIATIGTHVAEFNAEVDALVQVAGQQGENIGKALAAVRTGEMRDNIQYYPGFMESEVVSPMYYSEFVNSGTVHMSAQPFMTPAFDLASEDLKVGIQAL